MHNLTRVAGITDRFPAELDFATPQFVDCKGLMLTASFIIDLRQYSIVPHRLRPTSKNGREHALSPVDRRS